MKKVLPTREGRHTGRGNERQMMNRLDNGALHSYRTETRKNADGSTTTLRTRGGMPEFITTKPEKEVERELMGVFQCLAVPYNGTQHTTSPTAGYQPSYKQGATWTLKLKTGAFHDERVKHTVTDWFKKELTDPLNKPQYVDRKMPGTLDWFNKTTLADPKNPTVTFFNSLGSVGFQTRMSYFGTETSAQNTFERGQLYRTGDFVEYWCVWKNGKKHSLESIDFGKARVLGAGMFAGKLRAILLTGAGGVTSANRAVRQLTLVEEDASSTFKDGWRLAHTLEVNWDVRQSFFFNSSGTKACSIICDQVNTNNYDEVVEIDFANGTWSKSHEGWLWDKWYGDSFSTTYELGTVPGAGPTYATVKKSNGGIDNWAHVQSNGLETPIYADYDGDTLKVVKRFGCTQVKACPPVQPTYEYHHAGWQTIDVSAEMDALRDALAALVWEDDGYTLSESEIESEARAAIIGPTMLSTSFIDPSGNTSYTGVLSDDGNLARLSNGYYTHAPIGEITLYDGSTVVGAGGSATWRHDSTGYVLPDGSKSFSYRLYRKDTVGRQVTPPASPTLSLTTASHTIIHALVGKTISCPRLVVTTGSAGASYEEDAYVKDDPDVFVGKTLITCDVRHGAWITKATSDADSTFTFDTPAFDTISNTIDLALSVPDKVARVYGAWTYGPEWGAAWLTLTQDGQHAVWGMPHTGTSIKHLKYVHRGGAAVDLAPTMPGLTSAVYTAPVFYAKKKSVKYTYKEKK